MNRFAEYQQLRKEKKDTQAFITEQKTRGLAQKEQAGGDLPLGLETIQEQAQVRAQQASFAEQSEYYFQNADLLDAKVERYQSLNQDASREVRDFARTHPNRSARKRRKEIMQLRMTGMEAAAKVKSTSKKNEAYRISKARYSCLLVMKRQLSTQRAKQQLFFEQSPLIQRKVFSEIAPFYAIDDPDAARLQVYEAEA